LLRFHESTFLNSNVISWSKDTAQKRPGANTHLIIRRYTQTFNKCRHFEGTWATASLLIWLYPFLYFPVTASPT
jgi:hypothetical protein